MSSIKDVERQRAKFAYKCVEDVINQKQAELSEYKSYVKKIPMMILINGLAPTFAFILSKAKNKNAYYFVYRNISSWLESEDARIQKQGKEDLMVFILAQNSQNYRVLSNDILALFSWIKRLADGMIEDKTENEIKSE